MNKFYITTAIAYTSRKPHIGNTYEVVLTDTIARFKRAMGFDVFFLTGTDEHGQKIEQIAKQTGLTCKQYVDKVACEIKSIWDLMNSSYDKFIRTTDDYHIKKVQGIFKKLYEQGDIYKGQYEGLYCVPCESFFTETQLKDGCCPDCARPVEKTKEEAYFFRMSKYQDKLIKHIEEHPDFICPESRKKEMINNFLKPGLQDLCVSRSTFQWGIPVEFDQGHVIYVWIDALSNYITALDYDVEGSGELYKKYWPCDVHVIGKDILRFHTIYWPIILMALGEPLPNQIFGHPWLLSGNDKMSKSKGNVIYADDLVHHFGVDAVRYYLLKEMPYAQDGTITYETLITKYNSDLANTLGNLVNRSIAMSHKYFGGQTENAKVIEPVDEDLIAACLKATNEVIGSMNGFKAADALESILSLARRSNKYIDDTLPWVLAKEESTRDRLKTVLYNLLEAIRYIGVLLSPFLPETAKSILEQINAEDSTFDSLKSFGKIKNPVNQGVPLFARIDEKKKLEEIEKELMDTPTTNCVKKPEEKNEISIEDFSKIELKIGDVIESKRVEGADKLLVSKIKIGDEIRQIVSGIAAFYPPEEMVGKKVIVVTNLKPVKLRGVLSEGMILAAATKDSLSLIAPDKNLESGTPVR